MPRIRILDVMLLVAGVAVTLAMLGQFWNPNFKQDQMMVFGALLGLVTTSGLGLWGHRLPPRPFLAGFFAFGLAYVVLGLWLIGPEGRLDDRSAIGVGYAFLAGVAARWVVPRAAAAAGDAP